MDWFGKFKSKSASSEYVNDVDNGKKNKSIYDFDPSGLERAARASQALQSDPHAKDLIEQQTLVLKNRTLELLKDQKNVELKIEESKKDAIKQQHDYTIEVLKEEAKTHRTKAEYEDFLARKRNEDRVQLEKQSQIDMLKFQEESIGRQEKLRRETIDYDNLKRNLNQSELSPQYWENKAAYKRKINDLSLSKLSMKLENKYKQTQFVLSSLGTMISDGFNSLYENPSKFLSFTAGACLLTAGFVASKKSVALGFRQLESYLFTPKLIKERAKVNFLSGSQLHKSFDDLGMFYNISTQKKLEEVINMTKNCRDSKGPLRNLLFYGPPGTGKTLFAKYLAKSSGLNYAILGGGDIVPLGSNAVTELHKVFNWSSSSKGLILFLDEADAFLKQRGHADIGENMRSALNTFLYRTGAERSKNLMLILATNKPEELDSAVTDRIYTMVEFSLPDRSTRTKLFEYYLAQLVKDIEFSDFKVNEIIPLLVSGTEGFSAREISNLCETWHDIALSQSERKLFKITIMGGLADVNQQHTTKTNWNKKKDSDQKTL